MDPSISKGFGITPTNAAAAQWWRTAPVDVVAKRFSPQVALANYWGLPWAPYSQSITVQLTDPVATVGPFGFPNNNDRISVVSVVDALMLQIDAPNLFPGTQLQPFTNFFYARQSGINATMIIDGSPKYVVAPDFIPIANLVAMTNEAWPSGWVLGYTQSPKMQFSPSIPLSAPPVTVYVTFRMWQPAAAMKMIGMTDGRAVQILRDAGALTDADVAAFQAGGWL